MIDKLVQNIILPGDTPVEIQGPLPTISGTPGATEFPTLASIITKALPIVFSLAGIILLVVLVLGGFDYLTSMGDSKKAEAAKSKITSAVIGIFIIFISYWLVQLIDYVFKLGVYHTP